MTAQRLSLAGGGLWGVFRFAAVLFLVLRVAPETGPFYHVNLVWIGAPSLLYVALFFMSALDPNTLPSHLPLLRLGAALHVVSDVAVVVTRSFQTLDERAGAAEATFRLVYLIGAGILVVDLLIGAALLAYRDGDRS